MPVSRKHLSVHNYPQSLANIILPKLVLFLSWGNVSVMVFCANIHHSASPYASTPANDTSVESG